MRVVWEPYERATRLTVMRFDHSSRGTKSFADSGFHSVILRPCCLGEASLESPKDNRLMWLDHAGPFEPLSELLRRGVDRARI